MQTPGSDCQGWTREDMTGVWAELAFLDFFLLVFSENDLAISKSFFLVAVGNNTVVRKGESSSHYMNLLLNFRSVFSYICPCA